MLQYIKKKSIFTSAENVVKKHHSDRYYINIIKRDPTQKYFSNLNKKEPLTKVVFLTNFEQMYCSPRSISLKSLNYMEYSINQKLTQIRRNDVKATPFVLTSIMHLLDGLLLRFGKRKLFIKSIILLVFQFV